MLERSDKRFKPAEDGDNVNVPIPEVDRGLLDPANFTAVVMMMKRVFAPLEPKLEH